MNGCTEVNKEYARELLSWLEDDLFENVGVDYDELDDAVVKTLELALEIAKSKRGE